MYLRLEISPVWDRKRILMFSVEVVFDLYALVACFHATVDVFEKSTGEERLSCCVEVEGFTDILLGVKFPQLGVRHDVDTCLIKYEQ